jgi:hypothetical protein
LGDNFLVGGFDLSGDTNSLSGISTPMAVLDLTGINKSAHERQYGERDGMLKFVSYFNKIPISGGGAHDVLSLLPRTDVMTSYLRGTTLGAPAACMVAKQIDYDGTRATDGALTFAVDAQSNAFGQDWGLQLTAGLRTDTTATNGTSINTTASASFGAIAYLQVTAFTGTDCTVHIQDSADNSSFADVTGLVFAATTAANTTQRLATASATATVRQYIRATTTTSAGFTSITFSAVITKNTAAWRLP